jgi:hypothetical protein
MSAIYGNEVEQVVIKIQIGPAVLVSICVPDPSARTFSLYDFMASL